MGQAGRRLPRLAECNLAEQAPAGYSGIEAAEETRQQTVRN
jgi:hypothetical protein